MPGKVLRAGVTQQVEEPRVAAAEQQHVVARRNRAAVVPRPHEAPRHGRSGHRMFARLLLARFQVEGPRLGDHPVAHDNGPVPVIGVLGPHFVPVLRVQRHQPAAGKVAGHELLPEVPVGVGSAQDQHAVVVHHRQLAAANADLAAVGDVHRRGPEFLAGGRVQGDGQPHVEGLQAVFGVLAGRAFQTFQLALVLPQDRFPLFACHRTVDEEHPLRPDGDGLEVDALALVLPQMLAAGRVDRKDAVGGRVARIAPPAEVQFDQFRPRGCRAEQHAVADRDVAPLVGLGIDGRRQFVNAFDFPRRRIVFVDLGASHVKHPLVRGCQVAGVSILVDPGANRLRVFHLPQQLPVERIVSHQAVFALHEHPPIEDQRADGSQVAVDHQVRSRVAVPEHSQAALDQRVAAAGRIARFGILVRPLARAGQHPASQRDPRSDGPDDALTGDGHLRQPGSRRRLRQSLARRAGRTAQGDDPAGRFEVPSQFLRVARNRARRKQGVRDDQIGEVVRVRNCGQIGLMHRDAMAVQPGGRQRPAGFLDFVFVRLDREDLQLAAACQFQREPSLFVAHDQAVPAFHPRGLQNFLGGTLVHGSPLVRRERMVRSRCAGRCIGRCVRRRRAGKTVDLARRGTDQEVARSDGEPPSLPLDVGLPDLLARCRFERGDVSFSAGEHRAARDDQAGIRRARPPPDYAHIDDFLHALAQLGHPLAHRAGLVAGARQFAGQIAQLVRDPDTLVARRREFFSLGPQQFAAGRDVVSVLDHDQVRAQRVRLQTPVGDQRVRSGDGRTGEAQRGGSPADEFPGGSTDGLGTRPSRRNVQHVRRCQQVALRRKVVAPRIQVAEVVVSPQQRAVGGAGRAQVNVLVREDARSEIGHALVNQHTGPHGPAGDHLAAGQKPFLVRPQPLLPGQTPGLGVQAVRITVVGTDIHPARRDAGGQPNRRVRKESPDLFAGVQVQAANLVVDGRAEEDARAYHRHLQRIVEPHAVADLLALDDPSHRLRPRAPRNGR